MLGKVDPSSFSNHDEIAVSDIALFLSVDFSRKVLSGRVHLTCIRLVDNPESLILDAKDLTIKSVTLLDGNQPLNYSITPSFKTFGSALKISIPNGKIQSTLTVAIEYETSPEASGLQWLNAEQTLGKKEPYLFSQCQAIHARSVLPCQDSPGVKVRYTAEVTAPKQLTVLLSALHEGEPTDLGDGNRLFKFRQPVPIPSYLFAIAVGRLGSRTLGPRSRVWAEPETLEAAAYEFVETEKMLDCAIELGGEYLWSVYDVLVMPPSFPFGGMENPCITFVTPTVLAGDRSLVDVIAHEISHSWSGNLVTTATFEHFWLNEGWTMFLERKIHEKMHGTSQRHFHATQGLEALKETVEVTLKNTPEFTKLVPNLTEVDPDDAFSTVPYEKGHTFLFYLEQLVGGSDEFNPFIKSYFSNFKNKSITTNDFKNYFLNYFKKNKNVSKIEWESWLYKPGMPLEIPEYDTSLTLECTDLAKMWRDSAAGRSPSDIKKMSSGQIAFFLSKLRERGPLPADSARRLTEVYSLDKLKNSEIRYNWIRINIKAHVPEIIPQALEFINGQGRMKFVRPIYRDMYDWVDTREQAIENYEKNKNAMMFVLSHQLKKDLHLL